MQNDEYEKYKNRDPNDNDNENRKYGPEIRYESYSQFYFRKFKRDFVYCKVKN